MMFMSVQGYEIENNLNDQDNQSTICLDKMDVIFVRENPDIYISDISL